MVFYSIVWTHDAVYIFYKYFTKRSVSNIIFSIHSLPLDEIHMVSTKLCEFHF